MDQLIAQLRNIEEINILFLCAGNICRSPMAEMYLELKLEQQYGLTRIRTASGGTTYYNERLMDITKDWLIQEGVSPERILKFFPRNVKEYPELLETADLIIGMESTHIRLIPKKYRGKGITLAVLATGKKYNIPDPWGDAIGVYHETFTIIKDYLQQLIAKFEEWGLVP
ncbi:MAG: arsenate reductase/protein-tyrosine-phosphatase family protein [Candidatus Helarchaeota archaeon]